MEDKIIINNLKKTFKLSAKQQKIQHTKDKTKVAVNDLSLRIRDGEIYGLLGPNGAGKTTTLRIISTLIKSDEGDVIIDGTSVKNDPDEIRRKIGFLTSELKLDDFFTPNYYFDYFSRLHDVNENLIQERKEKLFKEFGIDEFKEVKFGDLSTGMKQKVSLVISIVHDPDIIIFDEPTNGLDVITAKTVTDFLLNLKTSGKTIVISTHIFSLVEKICDRVGIIMDGKLVVEDDVKDLTKDMSLEDKFFEIYNAKLGDQNA